MNTDKLDQSMVIQTTPAFVRASIRIAMFEHLPSQIQKADELADAVVRELVERFDACSNLAHLMAGTEDGLPRVGDCLNSSDCMCADCNPWEEC